MTFQDPEVQDTPVRTGTPTILRQEDLRQRHVDFEVLIEIYDLTPLSRRFGLRSFKLLFIFA